MGNKLERVSLRGIKPLQEEETMVLSKITHLKEDSKLWQIDQSPPKLIELQVSILLQPYLIKEPQIMSLKHN